MKFQKKKKEKRKESKRKIRAIVIFVGSKYTIKFLGLQEDQIYCFSGLGM